MPDDQPPLTDDEIREALNRPPGWGGFFDYETPQFYCRALRDLLACWPAGWR